MGYYSDVALALNKEANEKLTEGIKNGLNELKTLFDELTEKKDINKETGSAIYYWENIKWYGDDCEFVDKFIQTLPENSYHFMRLGEEYGDIYEHGEFHDCGFDFMPAAMIEMI